MPKIIDLTGQRFGRLVAVRPDGFSKDKRVKWLCQCDCGAASSVVWRSLTKGLTKSCGCLRRELAEVKNKSHGQAVNRKKTGLYLTYVNMFRRCYDPNDSHFHCYGARGIVVCERWHSFENFCADMGPKPKGLSIERIDNDGIYCPSNCRWATTKEQSRNTSRTILITYNGKTQCLKDWAAELGFNYMTLVYRLRRGWSQERTLSEPVVK